MRGPALAAVVAAAVAAPAAEGQTHRLLLEGAASHARPPAGIEADAGSYLTGGVRWVRSGGADLFAGARGGWSVDAGRGDWLSAFAGMTLPAPPTGRPGLGLTLVGSAFRVEEPDPFDALLLRARPAFSVPVGRVRLEARVHGGVAWRRLGTGEDRVENRIWERGGGVAARGRVGSVAVEGSADLLRTDLDRFRTVGAALSWRWRDTRLEAEYAWWNAAEGGESQVVAVRAELPLGPAIRFDASGGSSAPDPLLGTEAATWVATAVTIDVGEALASRAAPVVRIEEGTGDATARFSVEPGPASSVELLGDFTGWEAVPMRRTGEDRWVVEVEVPPGVYRFGFRVDGSWWVPETAPGRTQDEWGRSTATVVVPRA